MQNMHLKGGTFARKKDVVSLLFHTDDNVDVINTVDFRYLWDSSYRVYKIRITCRSMSFSLNIRVII